MTISFRFFLGIFIIIGFSAYLFLNYLSEELRPGIRQASEDALVDTAHLLAEIVSKEVINNNISNGDFTKNYIAFKNRTFAAKIWEHTKTKSNLRVYITDKRGIVIFDSNGEDIGKDYSRWNDVFLTLQGEYGVRTTQADPQDKFSTVMYVAAPIKHHNKIIGVLTIAKPNMSLQPFLEIGRRNIRNKGLLLIGLSVLIGLVLSLWLTQSIRKLARYADQASQGERTALPDLSEIELKKLAHAIERMRSQLDGKDYVENYIYTLTHEMKSPLAAIHGAAELLNENMELEQRSKFIKNIIHESERIQQIVNRLLDLAVIEKKQILEHTVEIDIQTLLDDVLLQKRSVLIKKSISVQNNIKLGATVMGDPFLLNQAISNLMDNAIDFSPEGSCITVSDESNQNNYTLCITDQGPGIPDYAVEKIFERFYSLARPGSNQKGTGLGLSFVKEISDLHHGNITILNHEQSGVIAKLSLPMNIHHTP